MWLLPSPMWSLDVTLPVQPMGLIGSVLILLLRVSSAAICSGDHMPYYMGIEANSKVRKATRGSTSPN